MTYKEVLEVAGVKAAGEEEGDEESENGAGAFGVFFVDYVVAKVAHVRADQRKDFVNFDATLVFIVIVGYTTRRDTA